MNAWSAEFEQVLRRHCRFVDAATPIDPDGAWATLGVDSFATLIMILEIEEIFGVSVPDSMLTGEEFGSPGATWTTISALAGQRSEALDGR